MCGASALVASCVPTPKESMGAPPATSSRIRYSSRSPLTIILASRWPASSRMLAHLPGERVVIAAVQPHPPHRAAQSSPRGARLPTYRTYRSAAPWKRPARAAACGTRPSHKETTSPRNAPPCPSPGCRSGILPACCSSPRSRRSRPRARRACRPPVCARAACRIPPPGARPRHPRSARPLMRSASGT